MWKFSHPQQQRNSIFKANKSASKLFVGEIDQSALIDFYVLAQMLTNKWLFSCKALISLSLKILPVILWVIMTYSEKSIDMKLNSLTRLRQKPEIYIRNLVRIRSALLFWFNSLLHFEVKKRGKMHTNWNWKIWDDRSVQFM